MNTPAPSSANDWTPAQAFAQLPDWQRQWNSLLWRTTAVGCLGVFLGGLSLGLLGTAHAQVLLPLFWSSSSIDVPWALLHLNNWPMLDYVSLGFFILACTLLFLHYYRASAKRIHAGIAAALAVVTLVIGTTTEFPYQTRRFGVWPSALEQDVSQQNWTPLIEHLSHIPPPPYGLDGTEWKVPEMTAQHRQETNRWLAAQYLLAQLQPHDPTQQQHTQAASKRLFWALDGYLLRLTNSNKTSAGATEIDDSYFSIGQDLHLSVLVSIAQQHRLPTAEWLSGTPAGPISKLPSMSALLLLAAGLLSLGMAVALLVLTWQMQRRAKHIETTLAWLNQEAAVAPAHTAA
jgi:hypothetical protein